MPLSSWQKIEENNEEYHSRDSNTRSNENALKGWESLTGNKQRVWTRNAAKTVEIKNKGGKKDKSQKTSIKTNTRKEVK